MTEASITAKELLQRLLKNNQGNLEHGLKDNHVCKLDKIALLGPGARTKVSFPKRADMRTGRKYDYSYEDWSFWKGFDLKICSVHKNVADQLLA